MSPTKKRWPGLRVPLPDRWLRASRTWGGTAGSSVYPACDVSYVRSAWAGLSAWNLYVRSRDACVGAAADPSFYSAERPEPQPRLSIGPHLEISPRAHVARMSHELVEAPEQSTTTPCGQQPPPPPPPPPPLPTPGSRSLLAQPLLPTGWHWPSRPPRNDDTIEYTSKPAPWAVQLWRVCL